MEICKWKYEARVKTGEVKVKSKIGLNALIIIAFYRKG